VIIVNLPPYQTDRFYRIWFVLLHYVNEQRNLAPGFPDTPGEASIDPSDALQLRNALWADDALLESFVATNPAGLSSTDLELIASWHYRVAGTFFVVRHLKKYSVFLSEEPAAHAYGVLGLVSPIEEVIGPYLPAFVQAVLLPFEGQIIFDSLLQPYTISFGPNIRRRLNDTYRNMQEREGIITMLGPDKIPDNLNEAHKEALARNAKILSAFRKDLAGKSLSSTMIEQHASNIDAFAQNWLLRQDPPRGLLDTTLTDVQSFLDTTGSKTNTTSFKRFVRFLIDTNRMEYEQAAPLRDFLQNARK
jgi:hypothetical protein